jgi:hypothetical protein
MDVKPLATWDPERSLETPVTRRANQHADTVDSWLRSGRRNRRESDAALLNDLERCTLEVLGRYYVPAGRRDGQNLLYWRVYDAFWNPSATEKPDARLRSLLAALLAADVEFRGPLRLTRTQHGELARVFEEIGNRCRSLGLLEHAVFAFDRAANIHLQLTDNPARDRCLLSRTRARHATLPLGPIRVRSTLSWLLTGHGYRPFRLLIWMLVQLVGFTVALVLITREPTWQTVYMGVTNYLNPVGVQDLVPPSGEGYGLLMVESYVGWGFMTIFFALLVQRWFRN